MVVTSFPHSKLIPPLALHFLISSRRSRLLHTQCVSSLPFRLLDSSTLRLFDSSPLAPTELPGYFSNRWLSTILVDPAKTQGVTRDDLRLAFEAENIECRPLWKPMHLQPVFANCPFYGDGTSEHLFNLGLCLPSGSNLRDEDFERIFAVMGEKAKSRRV